MTAFSFLLCWGGGDNVELKVIVKIKYQTKEKYVLSLQ